MPKTYLKANLKSLEKELLFDRMIIDKVKILLIFFVQRKTREVFFAMNKRDLYRLHHRNLGLSDSWDQRVGTCLAQLLWSAEAAHPRFLGI